MNYPALLAVAATSARLIRTQCVLFGRLTKAHAAVENNKSAARVKEAAAAFEGAVEFNVVVTTLATELKPFIDAGKRINLVEGACKRHSASVLQQGSLLSFYYDNDPRSNVCVYHLIFPMACLCNTCQEWNQTWSVGLTMIIFQASARSSSATALSI